MRCTLFNHLFVTSSAVAMLAVAAPAFAADADATPASSTAAAATAQTQEIVVTAQRRKETLNEVPTSIQAWSGSQLSNYGVSDISALTMTTPGFEVAQSVGFTQLYVRGIGNDVFIGSPSVMTYVDDVPILWASLSSQMVDVERVEVLKGAQGGLYGRNATGGVINIITKQPSTSGFAADVTADYGEKSTVRLAGYVNIPLTDTTALSFTGERDTHDPYVQNITTNPNPFTAAMFPVTNIAGPGTASFFGTPAQTAAHLNSGVQPLSGYNNEDFYQLGSKLLLKPADNIKFVIAGDYSYRDDTSNVGEYTGNPGLAQAALLMPYLHAITGGTPNIPANFFPTVTKSFTTAMGWPGGTTQMNAGASGTFTWENPVYTFTSISAYRYQRFTDKVDYGAAMIPTIDMDRFENKSKYFYQEFRFVSSAKGPFTWLGGATYTNYEVRNTTALIFYPPGPRTTVASTNDQIENWSVYGQLGYDLTKHVNLTVSGRYVGETNTEQFFNTDTLTNPNGYAPASVESKVFLPSATLKYSLDNGGNAYVRYARGFKSGGINNNPPALFTLVGGNPNEGAFYKGEYVNTYEVGLKTPLFERAVQLSGALFYNDYKNLQTTVIPSNPVIASGIINAGSARTYGAELSLDWRVSRALTVGTNVGYLNAKYRNFSYPGDSLINAFNNNGDQMPYAPEWQFVLHGNVDQPINDQYAFTGSVVGTYQSKEITAYPYGSPGAPITSQPGYWLVNLRAGLRTADQRYELAIFAKNLLNQAYYTNINSSNYTGATYFWGNPRIVGVELKAHF